MVVRDGARFRMSHELAPPIELTPIELTRQSKLRAFAGRLLGWGRTPAIAHALDAIHTCFAGRGELWIRGPGDLAPIAGTLHRLASDLAPFIMCDPRRGNERASTRSPCNVPGIADAISAASGGTLCVRSRHLPRDFSSTVDQLRSADLALVFILEPRERRSDERPIDVPYIHDRRSEMPRLVGELLDEAQRELCIARSGVTSLDLAWLIEHAGPEFSDVVKCVDRVFALRSSATLLAAAEVLQIAPVSLTRWARRRPQPAHRDLLDVRSMLPRPRKLRELGRDDVAAQEDES